MLSGKFLSIPDIDLDLISRAYVVFSGQIGFMHPDNFRSGKRYFSFERIHGKAVIFCNLFGG